MKSKAHLTRKNLIFLALLFVFLLVQTFVFLCFDTKGMMNPRNPIANLANMFGFGTTDLKVIDYAAFFLVIVYTFLLAFGILYTVRYAKYYQQKLASTKYILILCGICAGYLFLSFGVSMLIQLPYSLAKFELQFGLLWKSLVIALLIYFVLGSIILAAFVLFVNFKNIDKPYKFFGKKNEMIEEAKSLKDIEEAKQEIAQYDLSSTIGGVSEGVAPVYKSGTPVISSEPVPQSLLESDKPLDKQKIFPGLCLIDSKYKFGTDAVETCDISLKELCAQFRNFLAHQELYFEERTIREFIASLGTTRLVILEGLSGTGKSSLPRFLSNFISCDSFFVPVQSTWRDRTSIVGYFNEFSQVYNETDFLKHLYEANYLQNRVNLMVLDELNLSRIEYYFADFLSVLEYPSEEWKIHVMQLPFGFEGPEKLPAGKICIPENTFFIGTANKDDSTYTITDKVYDRAITINFDDRNDVFEPVGEEKTISVSYETLASLFHKAKSTKGNLLNEKDKAKFKQITDFVYDTFDLTFGNRIMNQIEQFVPVFVACGGTKEEALDFLFESKILYKLEGRFEDFVKQGLLDLKDLLEKLYEGKFTKSVAEINKMLKRL